MHISYVLLVVRRRREGDAISFLHMELFLRLASDVFVELKNVTFRLFDFFHPPVSQVYFVSSRCSFYQLQLWWAP
jgi:hypothetical protein